MIKQAIHQKREREAMEKYLLTDQTLVGLRIQFIDQKKAAMYGMGSTRLSNEARKLLALRLQTIANMPDKIETTRPSCRGNSYRGVALE